MRSYKHYSGATVEVDAQGKKTIWKYGLKFKTFTEIKAFERECAAKNVKLNNNDFEVYKKIYEEYRFK